MQILLLHKSCHASLCTLYMRRTNCGRLSIFMWTCIYTADYSFQLAEWLFEWKLHFLLEMCRPDKWWCSCHDWENCWTCCSVETYTVTLAFLGTLADKSEDIGYILWVTWWNMTVSDRFKFSIPSHAQYFLLVYGGCLGDIFLCLNSLSTGLHGAEVDIFTVKDKLNQWLKTYISWQPSWRWCVK